MYMETKYAGEILNFICFSGIELKSPYKVYDESRSVYHTYLDTVGRPVITARGYNLVEQHILDFEVHQKFC